MHMQCNTEVHSYSHCWIGRAISITYSENVFIALGIRYAMHMCHIVISGPPDSTEFLYIISKTAQFKKKLLSIECVFFLYNSCIETFLIL